MWYIYILQSEKDAKYYIGSTGNLERRLIKHNAGATTSTRNRRPLRLIYSEAYLTKTEAIKREYQIKGYKGGGAFKKLFKQNNMGR